MLLPPPPQVKKAIKPTDTLLVVDAMTGQEAAALVKAFNDAVDITGGRAFSGFPGLPKHFFVMGFWVLIERVWE